MDVPPLRQLPAKLDQFRRGNLPKLAIAAHTQAPRHRQAAVPTVSAGKTSYPTPNNTASVLKQHRIGRVKVWSIVRQTPRARGEPARLHIKIANEILHLSVRRDEKHPLVA